MEKIDALSGGKGSGGDGSVFGYDSLHRLLSANLKPHLFRRILLGLNRGKALETISLLEYAKALYSGHYFDLQAYCFFANKELLREPRIVRVGLIQNSIALPTIAHFLDQKRAIFEKVKPIIDATGASGVNVLCLQEAWTMPFAFCTREKRWCEFAKPVDGESMQFLQDLARKYNMVIIRLILERDVNHGETLWNTAVIIGNNGNIIGKHRKSWRLQREYLLHGREYWASRVFETAYGKIDVNICYGRHHPLNCLAFGMNGAEIVFNPSATAHNTAIANSYFVGSINHVGTEVFPNSIHFW